MLFMQSKLYLGGAAAPAKELCIVYPVPAQKRQFRMFGDLFSQNADYHSGILYQGRRKFLKPAGNVLEPPQEFKTKRQSRRGKSNAQAEKLAPLAGNEIAPQHLANVIMNTKNSFLNLRGNGDFKNKGKGKSGKLKPLVIQHYSSIDSKDWEEQYQAGCHLYVNKNTGEVSEECPWRRDISQVLSSKKPPMSPLKEVSAHPTPINSPSKIMLTPLQHKQVNSTANLFNTVGASGGSGISTGSYRMYDDADDLGTGSLVYDRSELDNMFSLLDSAQKTPKKS